MNYTPEDVMPIEPQIPVKLVHPVSEQQSGDHDPTKVCLGEVQVAISI